MEQDKQARGPGRGPGGGMGGFGGGGQGRGGPRGEGRGGREGGRGGREGGRGGRGKDEGRAGGAAYKVVTELSTLEKALSKADFPAQVEPLKAVLDAVKSMRLSSLEQMDLNARGRLITSLSRVMRQPRPRAEASSEAAPVAEAAAAEAPPADAAPSEAPAPDAPAADAAAASPEAAPAQAPGPAVDPKVSAYQEALFTVGLIWTSAKEGDRAATAFESAGKRPSDSELEALAKAPPPPAERAAERVDRKGRPDRPGREGKEGRGPRGDRPPRESRAERPARPEPFHPTGDWQADARALEGMGRTRDAGRLLEKNQDHAGAARLFAAGGDAKAALRNAAMGKLHDEARGLFEKLTPAEVTAILEKAQAWELLMEYHVARSDYEAIARLYERAGQFDQAALAYEKGGKLSPARKAYERAKDYAAANRMREQEVAKLLERGDRLGAATLLMGAGRKDEAVAAVTALPGPKAYAFLQKLKLNEEARLFAAAEMKKAEEAKDVALKARWHEALGQHREALELWTQLGRRERTVALLEKLGRGAEAAQVAESLGQLERAETLFRKAGDTASADRVKALPRPKVDPRAPRAEDSHDDDAHEEGQHAEAAPTVEAAAAPVEAVPEETPEEPETSG